ncbi:mitochondrial carrier domain-containing protein, partial [Armillaria fumosa]
MTSTLPPIVQAVSGAVGSAFANGLTRRYGLTALYDGIMTDTGASLVSNFCYYHVYSFLRNTVLRYRYNDTKTKISLPVLQELFLGFIAGAERDADDDEENSEEDQTVGLPSVVKLIYSEHGLSGFWRGFQTTILLSLNPSITLAVFQIYRRVADKLSRSRSSAIKLSPKEAFIGGAVSSSIAVAILYPLILAKVRLQAQRKTTSISTLGSIFLDASKSPGGLYQGLEMQVVKGFLGQGVSFLIKERIEQFIVGSYLRSRGKHSKSDVAVINVRR